LFAWCGLASSFQQVEFEKGVGGRISFFSSTGNGTMPPPHCTYTYFTSYFPQRRESTTLCREAALNAHSVPNTRGRPAPCNTLAHHCPQRGCRGSANYNYGCDIPHRFGLLEVLLEVCVGANGGVQTVFTVLLYWGGEAVHEGGPSLSYLLQTPGYKSGLYFHYYEGNFSYSNARYCTGKLGQSPSRILDSISHK
jgi:hypothetical protein